LLEEEWRELHGSLLFEKLIVAQLIKKFLSFITVFTCHVGLCHHGMEHNLVADGGDGRQIWRVTANILNKQSRTADKGWSSILGGWARG